MPPPRPWFPPEFPFEEWRIAVAGRQRSAIHVDHVLAGLAELQHGTVARRQLVALGVGEGRIRARLASGHLHRVPTRPGVYAVGRPGVSAPGKRMAAVLAAGRGARLAGWSGATQRGILPDAGARIDIAVPPGRHVALGGLSVLRTTALPGDVQIADGIPTHSVARLLLDLARRDDVELLEWAWRQALYLKVLDLADVWRLLDAHGRAPGTPGLRRLYARRRVLVGDLRNRFEVIVLGIIREAGLPEPLCNVPWDVGDGLILKPDFRIPQLALVVESDGRDGHDDVEFLLTDDERDARYAALGHRTLRYSYWEAKRQRERLVGELRAHGAAAGRDRWRITVAHRQ
jgi:hypothetical protein